MAAKQFVKASVAAAAAVAGNRGFGADQSVTQLVNAIKDKQTRGDAWPNAGKVGAPAIPALAGLMTDAEDFEAARAAKRGMWVIVRQVGRPGADAQRPAVVAELVRLLSQNSPVAVCREALWMVSEIGGDDTIAPVAALLKNAELREDARLVLERMPGEKSLAALQAGLAAAPEEFKPNIVESLRSRGVDVPGVQLQFVVPSRQTEVKPA